jgi:hypothetical protein
MVQKLQLFLLQYFALRLSGHIATAPANIATVLVFNHFGGR